MSSDTVEVSIFGKQYHLSVGDKGADYVRQLAFVVDKKMKDIASQVPDVSLSGIAILACLNLADEMQMNKKNTTDVIKETDELISFLINDIDSRIKVK